MNLANYFFIVDSKSCYRYLVINVTIFAIILSPSSFDIFPLTPNCNCVPQDVIGEQVLLRLPDVLQLSQCPNTAAGVGELRRLLLMVLGCAVQGPSKQTIVENIKKLDIETQHAIVECIREVSLFTRNAHFGRYFELLFTLTQLLNTLTQLFIIVQLTNYCSRCVRILLQR